MDAISLLKRDHKKVESLFKEFEQAGKKAKSTRKRIVKKIVKELSLHAALEEQLFYPVVQEAAKANELALRAMEQHELVKVLLGQLDTMSPDEDRFQARVTVLIENVRAHVKEEETQMFPKIRNALTPDQLKRLGERLEEGKKAMGSPKDYLKLV